MPPHWLQLLAEIYVPLSIVTALGVLADILPNGRRQTMAVMEAVWPLTMLYWGPLGLIFYFSFGREGGSSKKDHGHTGDRPMWQAAFLGATHCGAGCALGDFVGDWIVFATSFTFFGSALFGKYVFESVRLFFSLYDVRGCPRGIQR